jgi:hypothetical protein
VQAGPRRQELEAPLVHRAERHALLLQEPRRPEAAGRRPAPRRGSERAKPLGQQGLFFGLKGAKGQFFKFFQWEDDEKAILSGSEIAQDQQAVHDPVREPAGDAGVDRRHQAR